VLATDCRQDKINGHKKGLLSMWLKTVQQALIAAAQAH
jgi:hypothetical protein